MCTEHTQAYAGLAAPAPSAGFLPRVLLARESALPTGKECCEVSAGLLRHLRTWRLLSTGCRALQVSLKTAPGLQLPQDCGAGARCSSLSLVPRPPTAPHGRQGTYQLPDTLVDQELREGGLHGLHQEAQLAMGELLQGAQGGAEVVVGLTGDVQVSQREVEPADQPAHSAITTVAISSASPAAPPSGFSLAVLTERLLRAQRLSKCLPESARKPGYQLHFTDVEMEA